MKRINNYVWMAVVALTAASITACSNDDKNDENGTSGGTYRVYTSGKDYTDKEIPGDAKTVKQETTTWAAGTYVVSGNVNITGDIHLTGNVNLILCDGAELKVNGCIFGGEDYDHGFVHTLNIYGQSSSTGKLTLDYSGDHSLGVITAYELNIHGGNISVGGSGVWQGLEPRALNIYHGKVSATGIVDGILAMSGGMNVYGGDVYATSTNYGPALLLPEGNSKLTISGGTVTAICTGFSSALDVVGDLIVTGGVVSATGGEGNIAINVNNLSLGNGIVLYEGDSPNPTTPAADQSVCTSRYISIK